MRRFRADVPQARIPDGQRVYAIGDVHGRLDLLDRLLADIQADNDARRPSDTHIVMLGDLIDRGPQSAQVLDRLVKDPPVFAALHCVIGNHEEAFLRAWKGESEHDRAWLKFGGQQTLESYGISEAECFRRGFSLFDELRGRIPIEHVQFIESFRELMAFGDYLFVHAGIRPGVALDRQSARDLRWIREEFLSDRRHHGAMIVHGHTICEEPEMLTNRLGIDTGAYRTGRLTALGLEAGERWLLST